MNIQRTRQAIAIFESVVELSGDRLNDALENLCGSDLELRAEVESLLAHDQLDWQSLDRPIFNHTLIHRMSQPVDVEPDMPDAIGRFRLIEPIGEGAMGVVYRAEQQDPRREVAVKVIRPGRVSADSMRRFANEGSALARLRHPGIAQIFESGTDSTLKPPRAYLAMELIGGESLDAMIDDRTIDLSDRLRFMVRLCEATDYAHRQGVIHRDLKPANIRVERHGNTLQPKILDFGIARIVTEQSAIETFATMPGQLMGTLAYMSPEQLRGESGVSVDVYALGVLLFEVVTGTLPYATSGRAFSQIVADIENADPPRPSTRAPGVARDLDAIILKALEKDEPRRYQSAADLADDLQRFLSNLPVHARRQSALYVVSKFARRRRGAFIASCVAGLAIVVGAGMGWFGVYRANKSLDQLTEMSGYFAVDVARNLDAITGTFQVRKDLLAKVEKQLRWLIAQRPDDPELLNAYADVLQYLGNIDRDEERVDEAMTRRIEALEIRRKLCERFPDDVKLKAKLSIDHVLIGDLHGHEPGLVASRDWYERALAIQEEVVRARPDRFDWLDDLGWSYERLAANAFRTYRFDDADALLKQRGAVCDQLRGLAPDDVRTDAAFRSASWIQGDFELQKGNEPAAYRAYRETYHYARKLYDRDQNQRTYAEYCAGAALRMTLAPEGFEDDIPRDEYLRIAESIVERFEYLEPDCEIARRYRLEVEFKRYLLAMRSRDFETCHRAVERQFAIVRKMHRDDPTQDAATAYEAALTYATRLANAEGDTEAVQRLDKEWFDLYAGRARSPTATPRDKARFAYCLALHSESPESNDEVRRLAHEARKEIGTSDPSVIQGAARALVTIGDSEDAREYYEAALDMLPDGAALRATILEDLKRLSSGEAVESDR